MSAIGQRCHKARDVAEALGHKLLGFRFRHGQGGHDGEERYTVQGGACARCGWSVTPSGPGLKSHRDFLSPRTPEVKWLRTCNPYSGWKLWRDWTPPKLVKVESSADIRKRE